MRNLLLIFTLLTLTLPLFALNAVDKALVGQTNLLENPGFESGIGSYTASSSSTANIVTGTSALFGNSSLSFDATTTGQFIDTPLMTIPAGLQGTNCLAKMSYKGGDNLLEFQVVDNSAVVLASRKLMASAIRKMMPLKFTCPSSGSVKLRLISSGNTAVVTYDELSLSRDESKQDDKNIFYGDAENAEAYIAAYSGSGAVPDLTFGTASGNLTAGYTTPGLNNSASSYVLSKTVSSSTQGQGWVIPLPALPKAKWLTVNFEYLVASGTFVAGSTSTDSDVKIYIHDVTNNKRIELDQNKLFSNSSTLSFPFSGGFQTAADSTNYQLVIHSATTSANQFALKIDEIKIGTPNRANGTPGTSWKAYTPTFTGLGSVTNIDFLWRQNGEDIEIIGKATAGTVTGSIASITLPSGLNANVSGSGNKVVGRWTTNSTTASNYKDFTVIAGATSGNILGLSVSEFSAALDPLASQAGTSLIANNLDMSFNIKVRIQGWAASTQQSDGYETRKIVFEARTNPGAIATSAATYVTLTWSTPTVDHVAGWNGTDTYTIKTADCYDIQILANQNAAAAAYLDVAYRIDGGSEVLIGRGFGSASGAGVSTGTATVCLNAGQTVQARAQTEGTQGIGTLRRFTIKRSGGGTPTISATARVAARYTATTSTSLVSGSDTRINFNNKVEDTHGLVTTGSSWVFKAQEPGPYSVKVAVYPAVASTTVWELKGWKNGSQYNSFDVVGGITYGGLLLKGSDTVYLNAGDTFYVTLYQGSGSAIGVDSGGYRTYIDIELVK